MITQHEFVSAAKELEQLGLEWHWIDCSKPTNGSSLGDEGYLESKLIAPIAPASTSDSQTTDAARSNGTSAAAPPAPSDAASPPALASWTLHACYSHTYAEPILYFQAAELSGTPLPPAAVLAHMQAELAAAGHAELTPDGHEVQVDPGNVPAVTQELHPLLRRPFYCLHPCRTGEVMAVLGGEQGKMRPLRYLMVWLRVAAGPLGAAPTPEEWRDALGTEV